MLVGYVSDERYVAIPEVSLEFVRGQTSVVARSTARGAVYADLAPGVYQVILAKAGYGSKRVEARVDDGAPLAFRLLADRLLGYVWPKWARAGEPGEFRVHSAEPYRLSLFRYGKEKEFVRLLGWFDEHGPRAVMQFLPDGDFTQAGVAWNRTGYGSAHHPQTIAAPARSGLYGFHAETESGAFFSFPWVVAPAEPSAPLAVLAATNTWNAYNNFGGRSNYVLPNGLPPTPIVNARQELNRYAGGTFHEWRFPDDDYLPLSFDRPEPGNSIGRDVEATDPIRGRDGCHQAAAEWRLLAWLEREGFDCDLYAEAQLHDGTLDLSAYKVLILPPHPEYWSVTMYRRVKEWVFEGGGRLMYLGGNGLNCAVDFLDAATLRFRTQLESPDGRLGMADPSDPSRYLESRFHRVLESEANLLGVVCTETGIMTAAPYRVVAADHWAFAGTGLRDGDTFGHASLHERCHGGASGHETDKRSASSPPGTVLLAKGLNPDDGGSELVAFETPSDGAVFSTGSITYCASLLVDAPLSRITRNVLERFLA